MMLGGTKIDATTVRMLQTGTLGAEALGKVVFALIMELKANGSLRETPTPSVVNRPDTKETEMTANQVQTEEQRIAEIKRKAEQAYMFYRGVEDAYYKIDRIDSGIIYVSYRDYYNKLRSSCFAFEDIEAEDKFFELSKIK